jgi:hypothetical protein
MIFCRENYSSMILRVICNRLSLLFPETCFKRIIASHFAHSSEELFALIMGTQRIMRAKSISTRCRNCQREDAQDVRPQRGKEPVNQRPATRGERVRGGSREVVAQRPPLLLDPAQGQHHAEGMKKDLCAKCSKGKNEKTQIFIFP